MARMLRDNIGKLQEDHSCKEVKSNIKLQKEQGR